MEAATHTHTNKQLLSFSLFLSFRSVTALRLLMVALLTASRHTRETQAARDNACGPLSLWAMSVTSSGSEPTVVAAAVATSSSSIALTAVERPAVGLDSVRRKVKAIKRKSHQPGM